MKQRVDRVDSPQLLRATRDSNRRQRWKHNCEVIIRCVPTTTRGKIAASTAEVRYFYILKTFIPRLKTGRP